jgi:hypothetical protein
MEIKENKKIAKATFVDVIKFKVIWIFKILWSVINYPFDLFDRYI